MSLWLRPHLSPVAETTRVPVAETTRVPVAETTTYTPLGSYEQHISSSLRESTYAQTGVLDSMTWNYLRLRRLVVFLARDHVSLWLRPHVSLWLRPHVSPWLRPHYLPFSRTIMVSVTIYIDSFESSAYGRLSDKTQSLDVVDSFARVNSSRCKVLEKNQGNKISNKRYYETSTEVTDGHAQRVHLYRAAGSLSPMMKGKLGPDYPTATIQSKQRLVFDASRTRTQRRDTLDLLSTSSSTARTREITFKCTKDCTMFIDGQLPKDCDRRAIGMSMVEWEDIELRLSVEDIVKCRVAAHEELREEGFYNEVEQREQNPSWWSAGIADRRFEQPIGASRCHWRELKNKLKEHQKLVEAEKLNIAKVAADNDRNGHVLQQREEEITKLQAKIDELVDTVDQLTSEETSMENLLQAKSTQAQQLDKAESTRRIEILQAELEIISANLEEKTQCSELKEQMDYYTAIRREMEQVVDAKSVLENQVEESKRQIEKYTEEVEDLKSAITSRDTAVGESELERCREADALRSEIRKSQDRAHHSARSQRRADRGAIGNRPKIRGLVCHPPWRMHGAESPAGGTSAESRQKSEELARHLEEQGEDNNLGLTKERKITAKAQEKIADLELQVSDREDRLTEQKDRLYSMENQLQDLTVERTRLPNERSPKREISERLQASGERADALERQIVDLQQQQPGGIRPPSRIGAAEGSALYSGGSADRGEREERSFRDQIGDREQREELAHQLNENKQWKVQLETEKEAVTIITTQLEENLKVVEELQEEIDLLQKDLSSAHSQICDSTIELESAG
ncbi:kinesin-like protein [Planoprotostelium fungivorum]|uniref:Kinesin-like protein n=1 Tax=Planoprotostelium fungivorum TaxID=1890364 RepID=A0A2P6MS98_9EUKA|nr:kinesin-like protein [Planoprotostelium fungivorum]